MIRLFLLIAFTGVSIPTFSASFDCNKARTTLEKLICANSQLSELDSKLEDTYLNSRKGINPEEDQRIIAKQKSWLKHTRNTCADEACLQQAYSSRIDALDPFADKNLTCDKMAKYPERIFSAEDVDLGSGHGSPIEVDYRCPESLASLPFLKKLLDLTETIRSDDGPQECTGSIIHVQWRYYQFELSKAGFAPLIFLKQAEINQNPDDERSYARLRPTSLYHNQLDYFQQWSDNSPYNYKLHNEFLSEFDADIPKLTTHYQKAFKLAEPQAKEVAKHALMRLVARAAGSFPKDSFKPESMLGQLVNDPHSTSEDLKKLLSDNSTTITNDQIYLALQAVLLQNRPTHYVAMLLERLSASDIATFAKNAEPLLSFALHNPENLQLLLQKKAPVNAENDFGKTALFYAIGFNDYEAVKTLLDNKADVTHTYKSSAELTPKDDPCLYPNLKHAKRTPLMHAAQHSDVSMLKLLIANGVNQNAVDELGFNALDYALMGEKPENESYLKSLGLKQGSSAKPS